ncbi:MAG: efflux RND transporter permease subunit, partial [Chitinispirillaceae bacterium]|nr:efflux RND transporter permease subunit [Chitinispirillaceae bacterium]
TTGWMPLGARNSLPVNILFVLGILALVLGVIIAVVRFFHVALRWALANKWKTLAAPGLFMVIGAVIWLGADRMFGFMPQVITSTSAWSAVARAFPGMEKEFMPALDEGSYLLMPTTMPHSGIEENIEVIRLLDMRVNAIPEVEATVGKWGRVNSALDPAPVSMFENVVNYKPEYVLDENGHRLRFRTDRSGAFILTDGTAYDPGNGFREIDPGLLVPDKGGSYFRQWRDHIASPDDIWQEIVKQSSIPGLTSAPKLQPIQTRLVMLQTGMRAPMGIKVFGPDLRTIEKTGHALERLLKKVPGVEPSSVFADRVVGKPYLEIRIDRTAIARYGLTIADMQTLISSAIGGMKLASTVEGRERFPIRVRYARELRDNPEDLKKVLVPTASGVQVPLAELAQIAYTRGPQMIKSEDTFLVGYVIFDKQPGYSEGGVVADAQEFLERGIQEGSLVLPAGVHYKFTGNYENQERAAQRLSIVIPLTLLVIFLILYFQFRSLTVSGMIFSGIFVAFAGGFVMLWLYGQEWFMNFAIAGVNMRDLFGMHVINLSVAVWVGFIALFGIAIDNGVIMGTYLNQTFEKDRPSTAAAVRASVVQAGMKRVRPAMMTTATAIIALIPVLTSTGKGADIMVPMAIPLFGGMILQIMSIFVVPVLYSMWRERLVARTDSKGPEA